MRDYAPRRHLVEAAASIMSRVGCTAPEALQRQLYGLVNGPESGLKAWRHELYWASWHVATWTGLEYQYIFDEKGEAIDYVRDENGNRVLMHNVEVFEVDKYDRSSRLYRFYKDIERMAAELKRKEVKM